MISVSEIALFLLVGAIVSLDVAGLTAVKSSTYTGSGKQVTVWAAQNAFWHAILLFAYGVLTVAAIDFVLPDMFNRLLDLLREIDAPQKIKDLGTEIKNHIYVALSTTTIVIVWNAYTSKIVENPFAVEERSEGVQRRLVRWLLHTVGASAGFVGRQLQAMAVAMDMLALAFLMKSLEMFGAPHLLESYGRVALISITIFISVFSVTLITSYVFRRQFKALLRSAKTSPRDLSSLATVLSILRIIEPLLIFYFLCEMMSYTVWRHLTSSSLLFIGAALLVVGLIKRVGLANIRSTVDEMVASLLRDSSA
jgi:hypothetical protein